GGRGRKVCRGGGGKEREGEVSGHRHARAGGGEGVSAETGEGVATGVIARSAATKQSSFLVAEAKLDCFASLAMTWIGPCLIHLDARCLDDRPPAVGLRLLERAQRLRRLLCERRNLDSELLKPLLHRRRGQHLHHGRVQLLDDLLRRVLRHP